MHRPNILLKTLVDYGPNKTPCCFLFSVDYYQSIQDALMELTHDELDLLVMGQVMAHTILTTNRVITAPVLQRRKELMATLPPWPLCVSNHILLLPHHQH